MKKRLISVILVLCLLLAACQYAPLQTPQITKPDPSELTFSEFPYTRPQLRTFENILTECRQDVKGQGTLDDIVEHINRLYDAYDTFYTQYHLANIHYCCDMTDGYWSAEYEHCSALAPEVDAKLEELYCMLAESPFRLKLEQEEYFGADYFAPYLGESTMDAGYVELASREAQLQRDYYALCAETIAYDPYSQEFYDLYGQRFAQILVDLVKVRQELAAYSGYESYSQMAYQWYYDRDYSAAEAKSYLESIGKALSGIYNDIFHDEVWYYGNQFCEPAKTVAYVEKTAKSLGGNVEKAFQQLQQRQVYDMTYSENKYDTWYCVYLTDFQTPFIFANPWGAVSDQLSFAHEFGHFVNDYICNGSYVSTDVSEVQSQGMEYMSLCYTEDENLIRYKLADSLSVYIEQAALALFELELYELSEEELTPEGVTELYIRICDEFAVDQGAWNEMGYIKVGHLFTNPMYIISYVVSNDLALQFYELETEQTGRGKKKFLSVLRSEDIYILEFAEAYGLENPLSPKRVEKVKTFFENVFAN